MAPKGSGQEIGTLPTFKCTYVGCNKHFNTEKEMKTHKLSEPEHNYCKKCDIDCKSWDDLTQHKVSMMSEFMHDKDRLPESSPKHITCEFCGEDFKSFGGRKKHRSQNHIADQSIYCPAKEEGCSGLFTRASHMIHHLEAGECKYISAYQFRAAVQHKHVRKEIMENPEIWQANTSGNQALAAINDKPGQITDGSEAQDQEEGGVPIMDQDNEEQRRGYKPLRAESNLIDMNVPYTRSNVETWPRMPGQAPSQLTKEALRSLSISSRATSVAGTGSEYASDVTSRRGSHRVYTESYPSLSSPTAQGSTVEDDDDTASETTTTAANSKMTATAWSTGKTSKALFKDAKPTPAPGDMLAVAKQAEEDYLASKGKNLLETHFYDPCSADYNVEIFFHSVTQRYCCPWPGCETPFDAPSDIAAHLQSAHLKRRYDCTTCMKRFNSATALTAHMESTARCRIKESKNFGGLLNEITGGFLEAKLRDEPRVYNTATAVVKAGGAINGVMPVRFKSKLPDAK
ncbi:hypothetical protein LTR85_009441 [Meristemomyces frigidus]|nr:hypothetical protein LTR85_009441 [Meristemomyces frigidus]